jgi:DNA helicase-2/ATP-dependent DNA helicase PcrA
MKVFQLFPNQEADAGPPVAPMDDAKSIIGRLNEAQQVAASETEGPVLIIAGPGSGKTRTLTHRVAYLIASGKAYPSEILALTFTNKAAREMRSRIEEIVGPHADRIWMGTFHAIFARLLRVEGHHLGYDRNFSIYDVDDGQRMIKQIMQSRGMDTRQYTPRSIQFMISNAKNRRVGPLELQRLAVGPHQTLAAEIFPIYERQLAAANALDFDDLLLKPLVLFEQFPAVLDTYRNRWKYIHIDEYQDTNKAQYALARALAGAHSNICVVGDDAQSIYAFRGADISNILSFQKDYPSANVLRLEQNYRSTQRILRVAEAIIRGNEDQLKKSLWTENGEGEPVRLMEALSEKDEAQRVERIVRDQCLRYGLSLNQIAVLYRTNAQSRSFEDALRRGGIAYRVVGGVSFYQRREIKDALSYLRLLVNPADEASLRRIVNVPTRGIGDKSLDQLTAFASDRGLNLFEALGRAAESGASGRAAKAMITLHSELESHAFKAQTADGAEVAKALLSAVGYLEMLRAEDTQESLTRWDNLQELISAIAEFTQAAEGGTLADFLQEVSLLTDADQVDAGTPAVTLMSIHASKGLEFASVFVTGLEEGLFPLAQATNDRKELEEERRLFYVAVTRAERFLYLSYARSRFRYGESQYSARSRFVDELGSGLITKEGGGDFKAKTDRFRLSSGAARGTYADEGYDWKKPVATAPKKPASSGRHIVYDDDPQGWTVGCMVNHPQFGVGRIKRLDGTGRDARAVVDFREVGTKKLVLRFAGLERVDIDG